MTGLCAKLAGICGVTECRVAEYVDVTVALWKLECLKHKPRFMGTLGQDGGVWVYNTSGIRKKEITVNSRIRKPYGCVDIINIEIFCNCSLEQRHGVLA